MTSPPTGTRWISRDLSHLYTEARTNGPLYFDVVIVGSGYGGAMAAAELAGRQDWMGNEVRVLVLERGKEYVPGMFPSSGEELPPHVRFHRSQSGQTTGWLDGLFDLRLGPDVCALVANGVGGGSLINAGVMEIPDWSSVPRLPDRLKNALTDATMNQVKERLGARSNGTDNTVLSPGNFPPGMEKTQALKGLGTGTMFHAAAITVEMNEHARGDPWNRCVQCGDCMTGCNVGAKKSLDTTLLLEALTRGARIVSGASVTRIKRTKPAHQWELSVAFTGESLRRRHSPLPVRAGTVILAAGTLGSPEILMRSQNFNLMFSPRLGQQFSCNGDNILAVQNTGKPTNSVADEYDALDKRKVGPTITGVLKFKAEQSGPAFLVQEFAVPGSLKRIFEEVVTTSALLHRIPTRDRDIHSGDCKGRDPLAIDPDGLQQALVLGIIGHDESSGELRLPPSVRMDDSRAVEGRICIDWPDVRKSRLVDDAYDRVEKQLGKDRPALPNPLWRLLPEDMDFVFRSERGPLLTVHPLGGCPIGDNREVGAVDDYGRVFDANLQHGATAVHQGLRVLDGSILPSSLGANPALSIAAVAQRAALQLAGECGWVRHGAPALTTPPARPQTRAQAQCTPPTPAPTQVELIEKLCGPVRLQGRQYMAELTVQYEPRTLDELTNRMDRCLKVVGDKSTLRLYARRSWNVRGIRFLDEAARRRHALVETPVSGTLVLLQREFSLPWWRTLRGGVAYLVNRGLRDAVTSWREIKRRPGWFPRLLALASRAGEVRRFDYKLHLGQPTVGAGTPVAALITGKPVNGEKRFTYRCRGNPWRQLTELKLTRFPGQHPGERTVLTLDGRFMARQAIPLARIVAQENQVHALAESASFALYFLRLFVSIHLWSFRAPDPMPPRKRVLLPGTMKNMGKLEPEIIEIELEPPRHGIPVLVRLTRYKGEHAHETADTRPPLVIIHGYSASGTSFAHDAIPQPMARYFWEKGRDVWLLDLRTSAGMASSILPWNFEDAALADIPVAIERICRVTNKPQVDVFAHCIGAVMLSMALLTDVDDAGQWQQINAVDAPDGVQPTRYPEQIKLLRGSIRRIVLSQKGPVLAYSDGNVLRGYLMRVLRRLILPQDYQFRAPTQQSLAEQALDRLLSSLPYPAAELARENPTWPWFTWPWGRTPWVGFRHRLDALYARAFKLSNIDKRTLAALEDLFGPLNLDTVSQAVHFARYNKITNGAGRNCFVTVSRMRALWPDGGTLSIHGEENGLADVRTLKEMKDLMRAAGRASTFETLRIRGFGHQDCVIGIDARKKVFDPVEEFLT